MKTRFALMMCCLMIAIAGCSSSTTTSSSGGPSGPATVVGKWVIDGEEKKMPEGSYLELTADGKITMNINLNGKMEVKPLGTYKVEGDQITLMAKKNGKDDNETSSIKSLNPEEMVLVDPKGKEEKFKRVK